MNRVGFICALALMIMSGFARPGFSIESDSSGSNVLEYYDSIDQVFLSTGKTGLDAFFGLDNPDVGIKQLSRPVAVAASGPMVFIADADEQAIYRYDSVTESLTELLDAS